jgi:hypothetical protein
MGFLNSGKLFDWGAEKELLLPDIDGGDFHLFLDGFEEFLKKIVKAVGYA